MSFKFERLETWNLAVEMADRVDRLTRRFPKNEVLVLANQMKTAADAISLHIAEGTAALSDAEQCRFLRSARRSAMQVASCLYLAKRRKYIDNLTFKEYYEELDRLEAKIQAFIYSFNKTRRPGIDNPFIIKR
jgi:four helix bundle protein